jgi:hypothetical protein
MEENFMRDLDLDGIALMKLIWHKLDMSVWTVSGGSSSVLWRAVVSTVTKLLKRKGKGVP